MHHPATQPAQTAAETSVPRAAFFPDWVPAVLLGLLVVALYWPALKCDFVDYDDPVYVTANDHVQAGLSWPGLKWAFFKPETYFGYWHPLTLLSHMLDCQIYGLQPWGHHLTNVLLHALNTALVFLLLRSLTGAMWRSVAVAALFAAHPLHVESTAWVAERKDVLSAFFGLLTLCAYGRYAAGRNIESAPSGTSQHRTSNTEHRVKATGQSRTWPSALQTDDRFYYGLALLFFALGLMSKPMLVTLPFVMLLLDYWPLGRSAKYEVGSEKSKTAREDARPTTKSEIATFWRLIVEKIPFFALVAAISGVTVVISKSGGMMTHGEGLSLGARGANALISYCRYLGKLFWPTDLSVYYPYPGHWPTAEVLSAGALLAGITVVFFILRRSRPYLLMGWLWFAGMLVPVIGLVPVGDFAMADRFTYLPLIGVLVLLVWGAYEATRSWRHQAVLASLAGGAVVLSCAAVTRQQLGYWQDSETLFHHALHVTQGNFLAHNNLGTALYQKGRYDEAVGEFQQAIALKPDYLFARNNLGLTLFAKGRTDDAIALYHETLELKPDYADARYNLGLALTKKGQTDDAINEYQEAVRLAPENPRFRNNLANALFKKGQISLALDQFQELVRLSPDDAEARNNLGLALSREGQLDAAIGQFEEAIRLRPENADARNGLGLALAHTGRVDEAISQFREAIRLQPDSADSHNNLGIALASGGRLDEAINEFQEAVRLRPDFTAAQNNLNRALKMKQAPVVR